MKGKSVDLTGHLAVIFKTGPGTYSMIKPEYEDILVEKPAVDCPPGLVAKILQLGATKCDIDVDTGIGKGYFILCKVQVSTENDVHPGDCTVIDASGG